MDVRRASKINSERSDDEFIHDNHDKIREVPCVRNSFSWLSLLPFVYPLSARGVHRSVLSVVHDLVVQPSRRSNTKLKNVHNLLDYMAESCAEHKLSLSAILQECSIANHTPMYWAILNYREDLLVALLTHSQPWSIATISDIRRACLASSNQTLFHALRVCRPPFHETQGLHIPSPRAPSDNLLLGFQAVDKINVQQSTDRKFVVSFQIHRWQRRINAIGHAGIEFIAAGRMWSVTFFSAYPSSPLAIFGKHKKDAGNWHVMVRLLESSLPTTLDSRIVIDPLPLLVEESYEAQTPREARYVRSNRAGITSTPSERHRLLSTSRPSSPVRRSRSSSSSPRLIPAKEPTIYIDLNSGQRKLGCRSKLVEKPTTKPDEWLDHGERYTSAVVSPLGEDAMCRLLYDCSPYLFADGTLRGRLEVDFVGSWC